VFNLILLLIALGGGLLALATGVFARSQSATGADETGVHGPLAAVTAPASWLQRYRSRPRVVDIPWWRKVLSALNLVVLVVALGIALALGLAVIVGILALVLEQAV
jgi:hypothetical protein